LLVVEPIDCGPIAARHKMPGHGDRIWIERTDQLLLLLRRDIDGVAARRGASRLC
jgi:hypothetical protein